MAETKKKKKNEGTGRVIHVTRTAVCLCKYLTKFSKRRSVHFFTLKVVFFELLDPEVDSTAVFLNVSKYSHNHTASHPRRILSSATPLP